MLKLCYGICTFSVQPRIFSKWYVVVINILCNRVFSDALFILYKTSIVFVGICSYQLYLSNNGPAVRGSKITFTATVPDYDKETIKYVFFDNAQPQHTATVSIQFVSTLQFKSS